MGQRRPGDAEILFSSTAKAERESAPLDVRYIYIYIYYLKDNHFFGHLINVPSSERNMASQKCAETCGTGLARALMDTQHLSLPS